MECILYRGRFEKLNCVWKEGRSPIYVAYQIMGAHKYHRHYHLICEEFIRPLYKLIFLEDCPCLSEGAVESIKEYGDYFFTEEGLYLRMYGVTKAPSLLPKYATDYTVLKEAVRQVFLDGFGNYLFDIKKVVFPPVPFYVGSYKFNKVKSAQKFIKDLELFHFGEIRFH